MKIAAKFNWRVLLEAGRWRPIQDGYSRGQQRIVRKACRAGLWILYPDVRKPTGYVFRRLTTALINARRP